MKNHTTINRASKHLYMVFALIAVSFMTMISACKQGDNANTAEMEEMNRYKNAIEAAQDSGKFQKVQDLVKEFYEESKNGHSDLFRAHAASSYGQILVLFDDPDEGKKLLDESLLLASNYSDDKLLMVIYNGLGIYEQMRNRNYYASSEYYLKSIDYARRCDKRELFNVLCNLSAALSGAKDTTGLKYVQEAYEIAKDTGYPRDMMFVALRMSEQMQNRGNNEEEQKWLQIYIENLPPESRIMRENAARATIAMRQAKFVEANRYMDIALAAADTTKDIQTAEKGDLFYNKAEILYELGKCEESNQWLDRDSVLVSKVNNKIQGRSMRTRALNYVKLGNYVKALEYYKKYTDYVEEYTNVDRVNILKAKEVALDVAQMNEEIARHKELERIHYWMIGGVLLFCIILMGLCLSIYNMYRRQRKLMSVVVERAPVAEEKEDDCKPQVEERYAELFQRMKVEIEEKKMFKDQNLSRESIASLLGTNRTYITDATKIVTGMSFPQYISSLRISEAERMLQNPKEDVSNLTLLGESLGFSSLSAFQSTFKKYTGMTLSAYREIARKKRG